MVRVSPIIVALATGASIVQALPAQGPYEKRAENMPNWDIWGTKTAPSKVEAPKVEAPKAPTATSAATYNKDMAYAGAALLGIIGAVLGGAMGAYMPPNTTFTVDSILKGLQSEADGLTQYANSFQGSPPGLGFLTTLIPSLGTLLSQQPGLAPGTTGYIPAELAALLPSSSKPGPPKPAAAAPPPPPSPVAPVAPAAVKPSAMSTFTPSNPAQRGPKATPVAPATPAMPEMAGMAGMGGHAHGGR